MPRASLFARIVPNPVPPPPPVPTTNWRMPKAGSGNAVGRLRGEALVVAVVGVEHQLGSGQIEVVPERLEGGGDARRTARVPWRVPDGDRARPPRGREVGLEPLLLGRARGGGELAVQHDHVPRRADVVAVVALRRVAGDGAVVAEVAGRARRVVVSFAGRRVCPPLVPPPRRAVAVAVVGGGAVWVCVVAQGEYGRVGGRGRHPVDHRRRLLVVGAPANANVTRPDEDLRVGGARQRDGGGPSRRLLESRFLRQSFLRRGGLGTRPVAGDRNEDEQRVGCPRTRRLCRRIVCDSWP